jgi:16S rRNA (guanine966-N2)-methyltransferase
VRIIGGENRSRLIDSPKGLDTRPTQDKVRESLFNILQWKLQGKCVLDLFAGSGALGLEALSRGSSFTVFVDQSVQAAKIIKSNVDRLGYDGKAEVVRMDWSAAVSALASGGRHRFDLVFLDPPYKMTNTGEMCRQMLNGKILCEDFLIVIEHAFATPPRLDKPFRAVDLRRYGDTGITFCACLDKGDKD